MFKKKAIRKISGNYDNSYSKITRTYEKKKKVNVNF